MALSYTPLHELEQYQNSPRRAPRFSLAGFEGPAYCDNVYDGDTLQLTFTPNGLPQAYRWTCRLARINAPELRDDPPKAAKARDALKKLVLGNIVDIHVTSMGKYRRPVVEIIVGSTQTNVSDFLLEHEFVKPY